MAQANIDVAKEASVQAVNTTVGAVNTNVGATASTGGTTTTGTVMAKLNALLTSWTNSRAIYLDTTYTNTAINNTASKTGTLSQKGSYGISLLENATFGLSALRTTITGGNIPVIKSVQRGYVKLSYASAVVVDTLPRENDIPYIQISITSVNIDKTFIIANASQYLGSSYTRAVNAKLVNSNTLRIYATTTNSNTWVYFDCINWQVVEFY